MRRTRIPIFVTVDDNYIPFLKVMLTSLVDHASDGYIYDIKVIHCGLSNQSKQTLKEFKGGNIKIWFHNVSAKLNSVKVNLDIRDYYSLTTYYRIFLPDLFPFDDKAIYLDSDIVLLEDVANLFNVDIGSNLLGAVPDAAVQLVPEFVKYVETIVGVPHEQYFNAGVLIMNFKELRRQRIESAAIKLLSHVSFKVAQDQDILNFLCKGKVTILPARWNVMPIGEHTYDHALIHYNLIYKPWNQNDIVYEDYFWQYAKKAGLEKKLRKQRDEIPVEVKEANRSGVAKVIELCNYEISRKDTYYKDITNKKRKRKVGLNFDEIPPLNKTREEVLLKIQELEREGKFDVDAENDPPYRPLMPGEVDFLRKKWYHKFKTRTVTRHAFKFFNKLVKNGSIVIEGVEGVNKISRLKTGAILTANHFNPFDSIPLNKVVKKYSRKQLFTVIREGNWTFPGIYGHFMRNIRTLPICSNPILRNEMLEATNTILKRGDLVLVYPEQSLWWNYRKPKPLKMGAFRFAARANVPVVPTFITMKDTDKYDTDGLPIQSYFLHILAPIYPDPDLSIVENAKNMMEANYQAWKEVYEREYGIPLTYTTVKKEVKETPKEEDKK